MSSNSKITQVQGRKPQIHLRSQIKRKYHFVKRPEHFEKYEMMMAILNRIEGKMEVFETLIRR